MRKWKAWKMRWEVKAEVVIGPEGVFPEDPVVETYDRLDEAGRAFGRILRAMKAQGYRITGRGRLTWDWWTLHMVDLEKPDGTMAHVGLFRAPERV